MMRKILFNHFLGQLTGCYTKIPSCPKMTPPISFLHMRKLFKYLSGGSSLHPSHDLRWRNIGRRGDQYVDMVLAYYTSQYLNLKVLTSLPDKITNSLCKFSLQNLISIFRYPYKMIFNFILGMTALSIFHAKDYKTTASLKLPA